MRTVRIGDTTLVADKIVGWRVRDNPVQVRAAGTSAVVQVARQTCVWTVRTDDDSAAQWVFDGDFDSLLASAFGG